MERRPHSARAVFGLLAGVFVVSGAVLVVLVLDLAGVANTLRGDFPLRLTAYVQVVNAIASTLLTLALVVLYRQQTQIQRRQEVWMEAEHTPDLFVRD